MFNSHITPTRHRKLVKLVGEKCEIKCKIQNNETRGLWDTGAMVSLVASTWLKKMVPGAEIREVEELLDTPLKIQAANKKSLPYSGWVRLSFRLLSGEELFVPFLVVDTELEQPIIGFNVIAEILRNSDFDLIDALATAINVNEEKAKCAVNLIHLINVIDSDFLSSVKSEKQNVTIPCNHPESH